MGPGGRQPRARGGPSSSASTSSPSAPSAAAHSLTEDITTTKCRAAVRRLMDSNGVAAFDVVLHDGSPNVGGAWAQEATAQSSLVIDAVRLATMFLAPKGAFITKVFRSQDYNAIMYCLKQVRDPLKPDRQKRNRDGYEEGNTTLRKVGLASDFIWSEGQTPLEFLGSFNAISFDDPASLPIKNHELTTDEIKALCEDLYVLDKNSFKHILKWRIRIRKALSSSEVTKKTDDTAVEVNVKDDDQLLQEMEELTSVIDRKKKREKKRQSKRRAKDKARKATGMQIDATGDNYGDPDLFSISAIKGGKELQAIESAELNVEDAQGDSENEDIQTREYSDEEMDSDEEQQRYDAQLEEMLDEAYERYVTKKGGEVKQERKRAKRVNTDADEELLEGGEDDGDDVDMDQGSDEEQDQETNPLLLSLDAEKPTKEQMMEQWFSQDVFTEAGTGVVEQSDSEDEREQLTRIAKKKADSGKKEKSAKAKHLQQDDFEIVPAEPVRTEDDSSSSSDESDELDEDLDDDTKAEVLAYARKMLRKKQREQILDDAYNKYMFDDEGLPKWFAEDEKRHNQPMKPVTKEEVAAMRAQFKEIDARPAKKVAEAKARKKRVAMKKLDKARQKADAIADQNDINEQSKRKMIDRIYKKAIPKKPQKEYVVAKKGVQVRAGKGKILVDKRMKKDKRASKVKGGKGAKGQGEEGRRPERRYARESWEESPKLSSNRA
ncbi:hypothetical protein OsJ_19578 [Oryza sativa Japonica Group]|uniref:rRNA methyltransferase n=1 Tax=Oryza sativa subsp. japonica TaxID=39947 RepID=B9FLN3_ORYSJ|nr:hypothetical protein OsJ_19578 [Oryza sativa Japonica Group]